MNAANRRKALKRARRATQEIKAELKADIAEFLADYWLAQFADLEKACKELLLDADKGFKHMKRKDLVQHLEEATEKLYKAEPRQSWWGRKNWGERKEFYAQENNPVKLELIERAEGLLTRLMEEIIGIQAAEEKYEPEGRKPIPKMEYYND